MITTTPHGDTPRIETPEAADALCTRLMDIIAELVGVLDRETDLLKRNQPQEVTALHARKSALSVALMRDMATLRQDAVYIKMAAPDQVEAIRAQQAAFQESLNANHDALAVMKAISESLLRTVADKVGARQSGPEVYGRNADTAAAPPARPSAISVDTTL